MGWRNTMKEKIRGIYERTSLTKLLTVSMVSIIILAFTITGLLTLRVTEQKIHENVRNNMSIVLEQYKTNMGNYITSIYNGFQELETDQQVVRLQNVDTEIKFKQIFANGHIYVRNLAYQYQEANSTSIANVYMNFYDGLRVVQTYDADLLKINFDYDVWKERFPENQCYWVNTDGCRDLVPDPAVGAILFRLYEDSQHSGIILVAMKSSFFDSILSVESYGTEAGICLVTEEGNKEYGDAYATEFISAKSEKLMPKLDQNIYSEIWEDYYVIGTSMPITNWKLVYAVEDDSISNTHNVIQEILVITAVVIVVTSILITIISRIMGRSLSEITDQVRKKDVLKHEFNFHSYEEINALNGGLEKMRQRINRLLKQVEMEQEEKRVIEIALMQEQINPHFLYNTLNAILQLCEMNQSAEASKMLEALSTFYRIGLSKGRNIITVEEELQHVENYLMLQHFRYPDMFDYVIDCEPEILKCRIPKMSLQPLVENAIYHGIRMNREKGNICIMGGTHDGEIAYLEVHDDGAAITPEVMELIDDALNKGKSNKVFGMKNVDSRIKLEFGPEMGIRVTQAPSDTCIQIRFRMEELQQDIIPEE